MPNDTVKSGSVLKLESYYADNDTRVIDIDNPKDNLTAEQINAVGTVGKNTQVLLGDKGGAAFVRFNTAHKITSTRTEIDLR